MERINESFGEHSVLKAPDPARAPCLELDNLRVQGEQGFELAIDHLGISRGETVAIIGANGSGKTTLIEAIVGLRRVEEGEVRFFGEARSLNSAGMRRRIGLQLQSAEFEPSLKIGEIMYLHDLAYRCGDPELGEILGLNAIANKTFGKCSGGQRQRLVLYTALASSPELVFLDEPTAGLDAEVASNLRRYLDQVDWVASGRSLVVVSHVDIDVSLAERVIWLENGKIIANGILDQLIDDYLAPVRLELRHTANDVVPSQLLSNETNKSCHQTVEGDGSFVTVLYGQTGFEREILDLVDADSLDGYAIAATRCNDLLMHGRAS